MPDPELPFDQPLSRRELLALGAAGLAGALVSTTPLAARAETVAQVSDGALRLAEGATPVSLVAIDRDDEALGVEQAVRRAAEAATDFSWLHRGDSVLIKPVSNSGNEYPATTDPRALRAMIRLLRERGAGRVLVGEMSGVQFVRFSKDRTSGSTRELMTRNRLAAAALEEGAELHAFEEAGWDGFFPEAPSVDASWGEPIWLPSVLKEVDHVVLMPRCSRHLLAGSTLGLKAAVGWWRHDSRLLYHNKAADFSRKTAESNTTPTLVAKQRLVLTSATRVLSTFGPDKGHVSIPPTGLVIASTNTLAHDMVSLAWLLEARAALPEDVRSGPIDDPNESQLVVNVANRIVNHFLAGPGAALSAQGLPRYDLAEVWDDRVLRHATVAMGAVPRVEFADAGTSRVPGAILATLARRIALPGAA